MVLKISGRSIAGVESCIEVPSLGVGFDLGCCSDSSISLDHLAISHGHLDHVGAIVGHAARRALTMQDSGPSTYYVPFEVVDHVHLFFRAASLMNGGKHPIDYKLVPVKPGDSFDIGKGRKLQAFETYHRVPSVGYRVLETRKRLKAEFKDLPTTEFSRLAKQGVELNEPYTAVPVAYTGDTRAEVLVKQQDWLKEAQTLIMEMTFLSGDIDVKEARRRGHVHREELVAMQHLLPNPNVILTHLSARHSQEQLKAQMTHEAGFSYDFLERVGFI